MTYSTIDHLAISQRLFASVTEAGVIHCGQNMSNHSPIYCKLQVEALDHAQEVITPPLRSSWDKASDSARKDFKILLAEKLNTLQLPSCVHCLDIKCQDLHHRDEMEDYTLGLMEAMESAAKESLPTIGGNKKSENKKNKIAGWNQYVKPYADECDFWHKVWTSAGKPIGDYLYHKMKQSKRQFKFAVWRLKHCRDSIQSNKFITSLLEGGVNFYHEIE